MTISRTDGQGSGAVMWVGAEMTVCWIWGQVERILSLCLLWCTNGVYVYVLLCTLRCIACMVLTRHSKHDVIKPLTTLSPNKKITTLISFSPRHWRQAEVAHDDKRHKENLEKWRKLADIGNQATRQLPSRIRTDEVPPGKGNLVPISEDDPTL